MGSNCKTTTEDGLTRFDMTSDNQIKFGSPKINGNSRHRMIQVLLIEDDSDDALLFKDSLDEAIPARVKLFHAETLKDGLEYSNKFAFDVVLLDLNLPDSSGLCTLTNLYTAAPQAPIVVLTGLDDEELSMKALQAGAQDYLVKGQTDSKLLARTIRYAIERHRLQRELEASRQREREIYEYASLEKISRGSQTAVTEQALGMLRLQQSSPEYFDKLVKQFENTLELSIEKKILKTEYDIEGEIRSIAEQMGPVKAGPRDVIDVYLNALKKLSKDAKPQKTQVLTEEGRFLVLALMGNLVSFYRKYFTGSMNNY